MVAATAEEDALDLETFAPYLINRISARYNIDMAEALREHGLTTPKMRALAVLKVKPGITVNELAVYAVMEQSTMSRTLDQMEEAGLVVRSAREGDGRVREVALTPDGEAAFAEVLPIVRAQEERMFAGIGKRDRAAFLRTLHKMLRNIRQHPF
ncbi:MarR family winged helix-turn-helix transcriptional regulator [Acuticoccus mangrovi]|uniref:MarR family transcriptional regulator n=1 Tax=Acuticoccus mangrovi TaxID=2796142 RepID=A0A934MHQ6_9HYPH|nr:MarR family transcriptional regulator [Acuticoccus mangrovi]MBJ3777928.1 MarR family transcriptional regulator [Acuticoccus mangrovi]